MWCQTLTRESLLNLRSLLNTYFGLHETIDKLTIESVKFAHKIVKPAIENV